MDLTLDEFLYRLHELDSTYERRDERATQATCIMALEWYFWKGSPRCPKCRKKGIAKKFNRPNRQSSTWYCCRKCGKQFTVYASHPAFFHNKVALIKWFEVLWWASHRQLTKNIARKVGLSYRETKQLRLRVRKLGKRRSDNLLWRIRDDWTRKVEEEPG